MNPLRGVLVAVAVLVAWALQVSVLPHFAVLDMTANLVLLVVVAVALTHRADTALVVAFLSGLLLDFAPEADHHAGRWALALVAAAWVVSLLGRRTSPKISDILIAVVPASFVATSVFALSGLVLDSGRVGVAEMLTVVVVGVLWDTVLAPLVVWPLARGLRRVGTERELVGER